MANQISDETLARVGILAKLALTDAEKEAAGQDMERMLAYIDKLNELDTSAVAPLVQLFDYGNVFREDVVTNKDGAADALKNAPKRQGAEFSVPRTIS